MKHQSCIILVIYFVGKKLYQRKAKVTKEIRKHGLHQVDLIDVISNPDQIKWTLEKTPTIQFFADLQGILRGGRLPVEEIGMVYRSIYPNICQVTSSNKDAYAKVSARIKGEYTIVEDEATALVELSSSEGLASEDKADDRDDGKFVKHNVKRREKRSKLRITRLQASMRHLNRANRKQKEKIHYLSAALEDTRDLVRERNMRIRSLERELQSLQQTVELLEVELSSLREETDKEHVLHESEIAELASQIQQLQVESESRSLPVTFSSRTYTTHIREFYYSLFSMRLTPGQIKSVVQNVISHFIPSVDVESIRFPSRSCASYMSSQEMPTLSRIQRL